MQDSSFIGFYTMVQLRSFWKAMGMAVLYAINSWLMLAVMLNIINVLPPQNRPNGHFLVWLLPLMLALFIIFQLVFQLIEFLIDKITEPSRHMQLTIKGYRDSIIAINVITLIFMPFRIALFFLGKFRVCPT